MNKFYILTLIFLLPITSLLLGNKEFPLKAISNPVIQITSQDSTLLKEDFEKIEKATKSNQKIGIVATLSSIGSLLFLAIPNGIGGLMIALLGLSALITALIGIFSGFDNAIKAKKLMKRYRSQPAGKERDIKIKQLKKYLIISTLIGVLSVGIFTGLVFGIITLANISISIF